MNSRESGSGNALMQSGNKQLPEPVFSDAISRH